MTTRGSVLFLALGALACTPPEAQRQVKEPAAAAVSGAITDAARAEAKEIFANRCTPCHGATGGGDGPASAGLTPKPRNFHDKVWQKSVPDSHIEKIVAYGGASVGKAPMMPANPDLADKAATLAAIREYVRGLSDK